MMNTNGDWFEMVELGEVVGVSAFTCRFYC